MKEYMIMIIITITTQSDQLSQMVSRAGKMPKTKNTNVHFIFLSRACINSAASRRRKKTEKKKREREKKNKKNKNGIKGN